MSRTNSRYTLAFKKKVVQEVQVGQESAYSVALKYKIGGSTTVYRWISKLENTNLSEMKTNEPIPEQNLLPPDTKREATPEPNAELEMLRLKVLALETMIDVAEQELGISIRKKSFAKQSKD